MRGEAQEGRSWVCRLLRTERYRPRLRPAGDDFDHLEAIYAALEPSGANRISIISLNSEETTLEEVERIAV